MTEYWPFLIAGGGIVFGFWNKIVAIFQYLKSFIIGSAHLDYKSGYGATAFLYQHYKILSQSNRFDARVLYSTLSNQKDVIIYEDKSRSHGICFYNKTPLWISKQEYHPQKGDKPLTLSWIRGTFKIQKFLTEVENFYNKNLHGFEGKTRFALINKFGKGSSLGRQQINIGTSKPEGSTSEDGFSPIEAIRIGTYIPVKLKPDQISTDPYENKRILDYYYINKEQNALIEEARRWKQSKNWYNDRGIPWTRGYLFEGGPGTGKTTLAKIIGQELNVPIYKFDMASMDNKEFTDAWSEASNNTPSIILLEDIDGVFNGRENVLKENGGGLTFDCILNNINGISVSDGIMTIITTNHIEKVDQAIAVLSDKGVSSRPGRIDRIVHFGKMGLDEQRGWIKKAFGSEISDEIIALIVDENLTPAQLNEICVRKALNEYWK